MRPYTFRSMCRSTSECVLGFVAWTVAGAALGAAAGALFGLVYGALVAALHGDAVSVTANVAELALCGAAAGGLLAAFCWLCDGENPFREADDCPTEEGGARGRRGPGVVPGSLLARRQALEQPPPEPRSPPGQASAN